MDREEREGKKQIEDETTGELGEDADDEESEDTSPLLGMVEVRESPHGGLGVFALRDFEKGEVVLREIPFMVSCGRLCRDAIDVDMLILCMRFRSHTCMRV